MALSSAPRRFQSKTFMLREEVDFGTEDNPLLLGIKAYASVE
jgi:hypothetical protein